MQSVASCTCPYQGQTCNLGMCPDCRTCNLLVYRQCSNPPGTLALATIICLDHSDLARLLLVLPQTCQHLPTLSFCTCCFPFSECSSLMSTCLASLPIQASSKKPSLTNLCKVTSSRLLLTILFIALVALT